MRLSGVMSSASKGGTTKKRYPMAHHVQIYSSPRIEKNKQLLKQHGQSERISKAIQNAQGQNTATVMTSMSDVEPLSSRRSPSKENIKGMSIYQTRPRVN